MLWLLYPRLLGTCVGTVKGGCAVAAVGSKIDQCNIEWEYIWDTIPVGTINGGCASGMLGPKIDHHQNEWGTPWIPYPWEL